MPKKTESPYMEPSAIVFSVFPASLVVTADDHHSHSDHGSINKRYIIHMDDIDLNATNQNHSPGSYGSRTHKKCSYAILEIMGNGFS